MTEAAAIRARRCARSWGWCRRNRPGGWRCPTRSRTQIDGDAPPTAGRHRSPGWPVRICSSPSAPCLRAELSRLRPLLAPAGMVWVSWPKKAAKVPTDITEDVIRELALPLGFVDVKVCAVDAVWSGLKLVIRRVGTLSVRHSVPPTGTACQRAVRSASRARMAASVGGIERQRRVPARLAGDMVKRDELGIRHRRRRPRLRPARFQRAVRRRGGADCRRRR